MKIRTKESAQIPLSDDKRNESCKFNRKQRTNNAMNLRTIIGRIRFLVFFALFLIERKVWKHKHRLYMRFVSNGATGRNGTLGNPKGWRRISISNYRIVLMELLRKWLAMHWIRNDDFIFCYLHNVFF